MDDIAFTQVDADSVDIFNKHFPVKRGSDVRTRFIAQRNGNLQIAHLMAMFVNFHVAKKLGGEAYLRLDDTKPAAAESNYIDPLEENMGWMGCEPFKITRVSDYFKQLYDSAVELISRGHAYVDHEGYNETDSPWRDRSISDSLESFDRMKNGEYKKGEATLRIKLKMLTQNFNLYDPIVYRIKSKPHPCTGSEWCIYPSYEYAHCIVDSLENITHSLFSLEFETRAALYHWLLSALGLYQPCVCEYSPLNITHTVMSNHKLVRLVNEKLVDDWDDPRLMTLAGLVHRGVTSTSLIDFFRRIGIRRSGNNLIRLNLLEDHIREDLNRKALDCAMVVLNPLKVVITNMDAAVQDFEAMKLTDAPADNASVPSSNVVYIEQSDFRVKDSMDYCGLSLGSSVLLRYSIHIKCTGVVLGDDNETVCGIIALYIPSNESKPKGVLNWASESSPGVDPLKVEVRLFDKLFNSEVKHICQQPPSTLITAHIIMPSM